MMTKKCKYALKALLYLGQQGENNMIQISEISTSENIPKKFLEQILIELKKASYVQSKQGNGGGYFLIKPLSEITVADVYRLFDGAIALLPCVSINFYKKCDDCKDEYTCALQKSFVKIREQTLLAMSKTTLDSMIL
jgi:Rrf2 family protein